jgi:hypothetical protein
MVVVKPSAKLVCSALISARPEEREMRRAEEEQKRRNKQKEEYQAQYRSQPSRRDSCGLWRWFEEMEQTCGLCLQWGKSRIESVKREREPTT